MLVGFGFRNENSPENFELEHHDPSTVFFHIPIIGIFSRIGDEFDLSCLAMYEHAIARSDFLAGLVEERHHNHVFLLADSTRLFCLLPIPLTIFNDKWIEDRVVHGDKALLRSATSTGRYSGEA